MNTEIGCCMALAFFFFPGGAEVIACDGRKGS